MLSDNITVCIFAWNEEKRILRCIENFSGLFDVLVVDNCSTDRTAATVAAAGHRVVQIKNPGFIETPEVMDPLMAQCKTDYLLIASVSEFIPLPLLRLYAGVSRTGTHDVVRAYRESITAGIPIPISGKPRAGFEGELRFFRKGSVDFRGNQVHGRGRVTSAPARTLNVVLDKTLHFYQFRDYDCSKTETVLCRYDDVLARQRFDAGERFRWRSALYRTCRVFVASYLRSGSIRHGMPGFIHSYYRAHMEFTVWLRIWEWENGYDLAGVVAKNDAIRLQMEQAVASQRSTATSMSS